MNREVFIKVFSILLTVLVLASVIDINEVKANGSREVQFYESRSQSSSQTVHINKVWRVSNVRELSGVGGSVTVNPYLGYVQVNVSGGRAIGSDPVWNDRYYSKWVEVQTSSYYSDAQGFSGPLTEYLWFDDYVPEQRQTFTTACTNTRSCTYDSKGRVSNYGKWATSCPASYPITATGFTGTMVRQPGESGSDCPSTYTPKGTYYARLTASYSGVGVKPASGAKHYRWRGTVYKGDYDYYPLYSYRVGFDYEIDEEPPTGSISISNFQDKIISTRTTASDAKIGMHGTPYRYYLNNVARTGWVNQSSYDFTGLVPDTYYNFGVEMRDRYDNSRIVNTSGRTLAQSPDLTFSNITNGSIRLNIDRKSNPSTVKYTIERADNSSFINSVTLMDRQSDLYNLIDSGLEVGKRYYYRINAENSDGKKTSWVVRNKFTAVNTPAISLSTDKSNSMDIVIDERGNPGGVQYYVERATNSTFTNGRVVVSNWGTSTNLTDTGLVAGTQYFYRVKARNGDNEESAYSQVVDSRTLPANVNATSITVPVYDAGKVDKSLIVNWTQVNGVNNYKIYQIEGSNKELVGTVDGTRNNFEVTGLESNRRYTFGVIAENEIGESVNFGTTQSKYTRAHDASGIDFTDMQATYFDFNVEGWQENIEDAEYFFEVRRKGGAVVRTDAYSTKIDGRRITGLSVGVQYELWMQVRNKENLANPKIKIIDEFVLNRPPELNLELDSSTEDGMHKYSELDGFNKIKVRGQVKDPDTIPVGDVLTLYYTIKDKQGKVMSGHNKVKLGTEIATGSFENISYDIPLTNNLVEGYYTIEVYVEDELGENDRDVIEFLVDRSFVEGKLHEVNGPQEMGIDLEIYDVDGEIAGLKDKSFLVERKRNNGEFTMLQSWSNDELRNDSGVKPNTKYSYRVNMRDQVGHESYTNLVEFMTMPVVKEREDYYLETDPSTVVFELEEGLKLGEGVVVEVRRSGSLVAVLNNGSTFKDSYLDFERNYVYELKAVGEDEFGERIESLPKRIEVTTGSPLITLSLDGEYDVIGDEYSLYRTTFSDEVSLVGNVYYRTGGNSKMKYGLMEGEDEKDVTLLDFKLNPLVETPFNFKKNYLTNSKGFVKVSIESNGIEQEAEVRFRVKEKGITKEQMGEEKYKGMFGTI